MSRKPYNKNTEAGYIPIRRGIYEHLRDGRMSGKELMVYIVLHLKADHKTGVCLKASAPMLAHLLQINRRMANRLLASLEEKGYIYRLKHRGQVRNYPVLIHKYMLYPSCLLIDAHNTKSLNEIAFYAEQDCLLFVGQMSFNCRANVLYTRSIEEIKNITVKNSRRKNSTKPKTFIPPTVDEVKEYANSINYTSLNSQLFVDTYEARGWMIGKNKMKDWRAAVRTWKGRDSDGSGKISGSNQPAEHNIR